MIYDDDTQNYILSSGRRFYAFTGVLGLAIDEGLEHPIRQIGYGGDGSENTDDWTPEERREVADHMIAAWERFAKGAP